MSRPQSRFAGVHEARRSTPAGPAFPVRREVPAGVMPSSAATIQGLLEQSAFLLAEADPMAAAKVAGRAISSQARGGRVAFFRTLAETMAATDPGILDAIAAEIARLNPATPNHG